MDERFEADRSADYPIALPQGVVRRRMGSPLVNLILFLLTFLTTSMAGSLHAGGNPLSHFPDLVLGLPFSVTLMAILLCHELGHYVLAAYHRVPTTLPYFIPGPPFLVGTFGAFIRMDGMPRSRKALFDVGAAGPWAGMVIAVPATILGLSWSEVEPLAFESGGALSLGNSILFSSLTQVILGVHPDEATILLHPVALAGWFGMFITFLNLLPIGQLDGGHVVYALLGRGHRTVARSFLLLVVAMGFLGWEGWFVGAAMLAFVLRVDHPDTPDADTPLDPKRRLGAGLTMAMFVLTFMPVPISVIESGANLEPPRSEKSMPPDSPWHDGHPPRSGSSEGTMEIYFPMTHDGSGVANL